MAKQTGNQTERRTRSKRANPFKGFVRNLVALHTVRVGEGLIAADQTIEREVTLANGAKYAITIRRTGNATEDKDAWAFPPKAKKA